MTDAAPEARTEEIVVEEVLPHAPEVIWRTLTTADLIERWLMKSTGFAAVKGTRFTFRAAPAGSWDGVVQCEVLQVVPNRLLSYSWRGGDDNNPGYGSRLNTIVTWTLDEVAGGTRLRLVHSGFVLPGNAVALRAMGEGWRKVLGRIADLCHG